MTDNEIVKALEYWKQFDKDIDTLQSTHPQYADMWDEQKEVVKITFEVFEEVNRQKAEIEKNENIIRLADKTIETANAEIERLKESNRILTEENFWGHQAFERLKQEKGR